MAKPPTLTLNGQTIAEDATVTVPQMPDATLRRMNHVEWLAQFAAVLNMKHPGRDNPMTPFRAGAISRLQLCRQYILLLEHENKMYRRKEKADGRSSDQGDDQPPGDDGPAK